MADVDEGGGNWGEMTVTFEIAAGGIHRMVASTMQSHDGDQAHEIDLGHDGYESVIRRKGEVLERKNTPGNGGTSESEERVSERFRCFLNKNYGQDQWSRIEKNTVEDDICDVFIQSVNADDDPLQLQITEADPDGGRWRHHTDVRRKDHFAAEQGFLVVDAADRLLAAIARKEHKPNYAAARKREVILLLNAEFVPEAIDQRVQDAVRDQLPSTGFKTIFVVGASPDRVYRLDGS